MKIILANIGTILASLINAFGSPQIAINRELNTPKRSSPPAKASIEVWSEHSDAEDEEADVKMTCMPSLEEQENPDVESETGSSIKEIPVAESTKVLPTLVRRPSLGQEASLVSNQSDTTLEFHDAPAPEDLLIMLKDQQENNSVDREVTVRLPNASEEHTAPVESNTTVDMLSLKLPEKEKNDTGDDLSNAERSLDTQEAQNEEECVNIAKDVVENVSEEQLEGISEAQVLKIDVVIEPELVVPVQEPSSESVAEISEHLETQEEEELLNTSSFFVEALSVSPTLEPLNQSMEENAAYDTIDEPAVVKVSEAASEEPLSEALVNHEQITIEPEINKECQEESMETSGNYIL